MTTPTRLTHAERRERREKATELIAAGSTVQATAERLGLSVSYLYQTVAVRNGHPSITARTAEIRAFVDAGHSRAEAAKHFGVSMPVVNTSCVGLPRNTFPNLSYGVLADLLNTKDGVRAIAARRNVSHQAVYQILAKAKAAGIKFPHRK